MNRRGVEEISRKTNSIQSFREIKECLERKADKEGISHQIFHCIPLHSNSMPRFFDLVFCSNSIARMVDKNILGKSESKRNELFRWIKAVKRCSTVLGWLFEGYANEISSLVESLI